MTQPVPAEHGRSSRGAGQRPTLSRWWLNRPLQVKGLLVLTLPVAALLVVTLASLGLQSRERSQRLTAQAATELSRSATQLLSDAVNAESGVRGFAATRNPAVLAPYLAAVARVPDDVAVVRARASTVAQRASVDAIASTLATELAALARLRSAAGLPTTAPSDLNALVVGQKTVMDRLRAQVISLTDNAAQQVASRRAAVTRLGTLITTIELVGLVLGVLAAFAGALLHGAGISRRVRRLADNADRIGNNVALQPSTLAADELGRLDSALGRAQQLLTTLLDDVRAARDQAVLATQAKNRFLSHTSHELRTPLNAILGFAQLLEMSDLNHDDRDSAQRILAGGRHLLALISELLDTALVETGELKMSIQTVDAAVVAADVATLLQPLAAADDITVTVQPAPGPMTVHADDLRLRQVILNLTSNAIKYNRRGGAVTITCQHTEPDKLSIAVTDTGPGLSPEQLTRVFIPFDRLDAEQTTVEGTGIGLPLALALTEAMDGVLHAESVLGEGSTFTVRLPRAHPSAQHHRTAGGHVANTGKAAGDPMEAALLRLLSIEDNPANALVLSRMFRNQPGMAHYTASTGHAGLQLAVELQPDIILLDLNLPDLPGDQVLDQLKADPSTATIPVVVLSADATPRSVRRLLRHGASGYLTKPVDLRELQDLITRLATRDSATTAGQLIAAINTLPQKRPER